MHRTQAKSTASSTAVQLCLRWSARFRRRLSSTSLAILGLCLFSCAACDAGAEAQAPTVNFNRERAWSDLERIVGMGPRPSGTPALDELRSFLSKQLTEAGLTPIIESFEENTPIGPLAFANLYADLTSQGTGTAKPPMVILATHMDTKRLGKDFVGANDGGSGTATLLELARILASESKPRPVTYRFLFLDGEESQREQWIDPDNRYGSRYHATALRARGQHRQVGALVLLDLVGDRNLRFFTESNSDRDLLNIFFEAARKNGLGAHVGGPRGEILDDHLSFMAVDIPCVDLIDFDYGPNNSYWHGEDVLEHCAPASLEITGKIVLFGLPELERWVLARR